MQSTDERDYLIQLCYIFGIGMLGVIMLPFFFHSFELSRSSLEILSLINWLTISVVLVYALPKGIWSISFVFFAAFGIFHGGLIFVSAVGMLTDHDILNAISSWFYLPETDIAIYLVNFTMIIYAMTVVIFSREVKVVKEPLPETLVKRLHNIGGMMLLLMIGIFMVVGLATGATQSYGAYLKIVKQSPLITQVFSYMYLFIGISIVFVAATYRSGFGYWFFIIFAVWGALAFKLGLRGEVMFPSAVTLAMLGRRRIPIATFKLGILVIIMLVATVVVKNARISGDYSEVDNLNPLNAVAEMGSSLRTIEEVITWRQTGFELLYGTSYWAPFERQLALILPIPRPPSIRDKRLLNVVVMERAGPIGFSPVAEAYANFGEKGIIIVAVFLGLLFSKLDKIPSTIQADVLIGVGIIPLFVMIRNSFAPIPVQIIIGIVFTLIILQLAKVKLEN
ncbi:MAG: O-antigen polysaccharide polymerase Wzy [Colwellia sp.]|jgi:hypothetical protein